MDGVRRSSSVSAVSLANQYRLNQAPKRPEKKKIFRRKKSLENCTEDQEYTVTERHLSDAGHNSWLMNIDEEEFDFDGMKLTLPIYVKWAILSLSNACVHLSAKGTLVQFSVTFCLIIILKEKCQFVICKQ